MKYFGILSIVLTSVIILFFKSIEDILINNSFSWTFSKAFPYLALVFFGFIIMRWIKKLLPLKNKIIRFFIALLIFLTPLGVGFVLNPIFEGDFSLNGLEVPENSTLEDFQKSDLVVITIPDCPYCYAAIDKLKTIKKRNPGVRIKFVVCSTDSSSMEAYSEKINGDFDISLALNKEELAKVAGYTFPVFTLVRDNEAVYRWSNDQFGVRAIDKLEKEIKQ
jgi:thiol-disulfide isomerase/thioredoxin